MVYSELIKVSLRYGGIFLPGMSGRKSDTADNLLQVSATVNELGQYGYAADEKLYNAFLSLTPAELDAVIAVIKEVYRIDLNWAALVRQWNIPTGETRFDHIMAAILNYERDFYGDDFECVQLPCGHLIPTNNFDISRYTGCPLCGRPFVLDNSTYSGQGSLFKLLTLWGEADLEALKRRLLDSPVPLDATQADSLRILLQHTGMPVDIVPAIAETRIVVAAFLLDRADEDGLRRMLATPTDVLRLVWYINTGQLKIIEPRTLLDKAAKNARQCFCDLPEDIEEARRNKAAELKLHFTRRQGRLLANVLNAMDAPAESLAEMMNAKRGMWVRVIRALRLTEHARHAGMERLARLLDLFYNKDYTVWEAELEKARATADARRTFSLLSQRPGVFARRLFANILRFGPKPALEAFDTVIDKLPVRLLLEMHTAAMTYFNPEGERQVNTITGTKVVIDKNPLLVRYTAEKLAETADMIKARALASISRRYRALAAGHTPQKVYIDPDLDRIPLAVGDRSATIQDASCALQGQVFEVEGRSIRLFMQWGVGLPEQHLDMDLSCRIIYADRVEECAYYNLAPDGAKHSGDIQYIPEQVGTAEYIELDLDRLRELNARFVVFSCNAYTSGSVSPNLMVGWMDSKSKMKISETTGVAYDPSCVQHMVRISEANLTRGLVFGILDVPQGVITWLEVPYDGQVMAQFDLRQAMLYLDHLRAKPTVGALLRLRAEALVDVIVDSPAQADAVYDKLWAQDPSKVTELLPV